MRLRPSELHILPLDDKLHWTRPVFVSPWTNWGNAHRPGGFTVDELGWVMLRGLITSATSLSSIHTIFTLPNDLRPPGQEIFCCQANRGGTPAALRVDVYPTGAVAYDSMGFAGTVPFLSLLGIRFKPGKRFM